jgi:hypothetical protein
VTDDPPVESRLLHLAGQILTVATALLNDAGYSAPDRQFVAPGNVVTAPGCETLAVVIQRVYPGAPGLEQRTVPVDCNLPLSGQFSVVLHRCVPTVGDTGMPETPVIDAAGRSLTEQGAALIFGFQAALSRRPGGGRIVGVAGPLESLRPQGGVGGWALTVTARV